MQEALYNDLSADYRTFRPRYPAALFAFIAGFCKEHGVAWDCATGNGQAATRLAEHFGFVWATDIAEKQIQMGIPHACVKYSRADCKATGLPSSSVDLVCVAQALHWFGDLEPFYREVQRVLRPGGVFAATCYFMPRVDNQLDLLINALYQDEECRRFWRPEFRHVEELYANLPLPFKDPEPSRSFTMEEIWDCRQIIGYLRTWPHIAMSLKGTKGGGILEKITRIMKGWGPPQSGRKVSWEVWVKIAKKPPDSLKN